MPKKEAPLDYLRRFIPEASARKAMDYLVHYKVHLTITRERKTVLGDYRHATLNSTHRISVNGNLNKYAFLITLIHELAHLVTFIRFGNRIQAHGREWKKVYGEMLVDFLALPVFPDDIRQALNASLHDLPASSCADEPLMRVLRRYDPVKEGQLLVEQVAEGKLFDTGEGRIFRKGKKLRKRYQCVEVKTGKLYLFSPVYEVREIAS
jgi:predicted SprT family Zn-dependent metalloprotease